MFIFLAFKFIGDSVVSVIVIEVFFIFKGSLQLLELFVHVGGQFTRHLNLIKEKLQHLFLVVLWILKKLGHLDLQVSLLSVISS